jgi:hypothetical protein
MKKAMTKEQYNGPRSVCRCGHTGDGEGSEHSALVIGLGEGHGSCSKCGCKKFTWAKWTPNFRQLLEAGNACKKVRWWDTHSRLIRVNPD